MSDSEKIKQIYDMLLELKRFNLSAHNNLNITKDKAEKTTIIFNYEMTLIANDVRIDKITDLLTKK